MKLYCTLFLTFLLIAIEIKAQIPDDSQSWLNQYFSAVRKGESPSMNGVLVDNPQNAESLLRALGAYYADSLYSVRKQAYGISTRIGLKSTVLSLRQQVVLQLLNGCEDARLGSRNSRNLMKFQKGDFSNKARGVLLRLITPQSPGLERLLRITGYLEVEGGEEVIIQLIKQGGLKAKTKWAGQLALARMGNEQAINIIMERVYQQQVNDALVYDLLPELMYTRHSLAINYMVEVLNSDDRNCYPPNPDATKKILCGYRVMEYLAKVIEGFPLKTGRSGDIQTDDYKEALKISRDWFVSRGDNYVINREQ
ncbi:hypothetical protein, partial [Xanthovirga aplysinae]|uniref:hypothetical protein n=1 Tax=Xanthovirga aplysinae TaxID=2529853 RepID=UPI0012BC2247